MSNSYFLFAQQSAIQIYGIVKDSLHRPIPNALITLMRLEDRAGLEFTNTDQQGAYSITCKNEYLKKKLAVKVAVFGFLKQEQIIDAQTTKLDFFLANATDATTLPTVQVKNRKQPVVQKGDTLSYDAARFTEKSDRYLGDIIKKLPGVEVDDNGTIRYKGKAINKFYIEGDNLLDDRYSLATGKMSIEHIDKVQVIEHNQHIKMLHGIVPSDRAGINIKLKSNSKLKILNSATVTGGHPNNYAVDANSMAFKKKFKTLNTINLNNTGKPFEKENNAAPYNNSKLADINTLYKLTPDIGLKLNGWYSADKQYAISQLNNIYFLPGNDTIRYREENDARLKTNALNLQLHFNINSRKTYLNNTATFVRKQIYNTTATRANNDPVFQQTDKNETLLGNSLSGYLLIKQKHILNFENLLSYTRNPQLLCFTPGALPDLVNDSVAYAQTRQTLHLNNFRIYNKVSYSKVVKKWTAGFDIVYNYENQQLDSDVNLLQQDSSNKTPPGFGNALSWIKSEWFSTVNLTFNGNRSQLIFSAPLKWIKYRYNNLLILQNKDAGNRFIYEPSLSWEVKVGKENTINLGYQLNYKAAGILEIYGGSIFSNYRSFNSFATPFLMSSSHNLGLGFHYKRVIKALLASIDFNYIPTKYHFLYKTTLQNNLTRIIALPISNYGTTAAVTVKASKYIFPLNTTVALKLGAQYISAQQLQNDLLFTTITQIKNTEIKITPTVLKWLKADISLSYIQYATQSSRSGFQSQKVNQQKLASGLVFYPAAKWSINIGGNYNRFAQQNNPVNANLLLHGYVQYQLSNPKLLLRLNCNNIAGIKQLETITTNNNMIITQRNYINPRIISIMASFDF